MNNREKGSLELTPAPEMTLIDESGDLTVLIKHDYYSSDTEQGRLLLGSFLDTLTDCGDTVLKVILVDSAVNLLRDPYFSSSIEKLFSISKYSYVCEESLSAYDIEYSAHDNIIICSSSDIAMQIIQSGHLITLE